MAKKKTNNVAQDYESLYRSYVSLLRQVDHLSTLREIGLAINSTLDLNEAITIIANVVQGALDVSRLTIYRLDDTQNRAVPLIAKYGRDVISPERLEEEFVALQGTPWGEAVRTRKVVLVEDAVESAAYVPLVAKNTPLGVLRLEERRDGLPFSPEDVSLYQSLGAQIAIAINNAQLYAMAVTDGLTGLYVRRYFDLRMAEEFHQAQRYGRSFALLLMDIDHFKKFNDAHGHQTGDLVLQEFARLVQANIRKSDVCCRYGGEEVAAILPETKLDEAAVLANKLCARVRNEGFEGATGEKLSVTTSIGVTGYMESFKEAAAMIRAADEALYRAKQLGRNRVELAHF
ncbi:MAG: sensor domain-containing diguanylate cyclase [Candidatus Hydrogenedentes bacterium]|nr:sensor domain-containing diguanylate cyclase [Candidatus Hydrogenedentota bacterium]